MDDFDLDKLKELLPKIILILVIFGGSILSLLSKVFARRGQPEGRARPVPAGRVPEPEVRDGVPPEIREFLESMREAETAKESGDFPEPGKVGGPAARDAGRLDRPDEPLRWEELSWEDVEAPAPQPRQTVVWRPAAQAQRPRASRPRAPLPPPTPLVLEAPQGAAAESEGGAGVTAVGAESQGVSWLSLSDIQETRGSESVLGTALADAMALREVLDQPRGKSPWRPFLWRRSS